MAVLSQILPDNLVDTGEIFPRKKRESTALTLDPQEEQSLLTRIARSRPVGALTTLANILDTPGSIARNTLAGENPIKGLFNPEERTTGRQLLEKHRILGENKPGLDLGDIAGFAAEVLTDPLLPFGGLKGVSAAGKFAKEAGVLGKAAALKGVGPRTGLMKTTLRDLMTNPEVQAKVLKHRDKLTAAGKITGIDHLLDEPLGGIKYAGKTFHGPVAQNVAEAADKLGKIARYGKLPGTNYSPGIHAAQLFNSSVLGRGTEVGQKLATGATERTSGRSQEVRRLIAEGHDILTRHALHTPDKEGQVRAIFEGVSKANIPEVDDFVHRVHVFQNMQLAEAQAAGRKVSPLQDSAGIQRIFRGASGTSPFPGTGRLEIAKGDPGALARGAHLKGISGGTESLREIFRDEVLRDMFDRGEKFSDIVAEAKLRHGSKLVGGGTYNVTRKVGPGQTVTIPRDQMKRIIATMKKLTPEQREVGLFGNSTLADLERGLLSAEEATAGKAAIMEGIAQTASRRPGVPVKDIIKAAKLDRNAFTKEQLKLRVPYEVGADLVGLREGFRGTQGTNSIANFVDQFNALFKAGVLTAPARYVRDLVSSVHRSWQAGHIAAHEIPGALLRADRLARGGTVTGAHKIPEVWQMLKDRGLLNQFTVNTPTGSTISLTTPQHFAEADRLGTQMLKELSYAMQHGGTRYKQMGGAVANDLPVRTMEDIAGAMPGHPLNLGGTMKGVPVGEAIKPWAVQGVGGRAETGFALVRYGNVVGKYFDELGRHAAFINLLKRGVSASEAARMVLKAQVDYSAKALTKFEKAWLSRLMPFYRFCVPTDHEILTRDGWKTYDKVSVGEDALTLNHATGELEWQPVEAVNVFPFDGELIEYRHHRKGRRISFLFTDEHRWPIKTRAKANAFVRKDGTPGVSRTNGRRRFKRGADLMCDDMLLCAADFQGSESILSPRHAAILGWVVTDGYWRVRRGHCEMLVYQSPKKHLKIVQDLLGTRSRKPHPITGVICVPVAIEDVREIRKVFQRPDQLPGIVGRLSREAAEAMIEAMLLAEGTQKRGGNWFFSQSPVIHPEVIDAFQVLALMTGKSANQSAFGCTLKKAKSYRVGECLRAAPYEGNVWCPTTANGTWIMRHNGAVVITGNSKGNVASHVGELLERPGGKFAQQLRGLSNLRGRDEIVPDYVQETSGIPIPQGLPFSSGDPTASRYLTGLGLMFEPVPSLLPGAASPKNTVAEWASQLGPLAKFPYEWLSGKSLFQRGPEGGVDIADQDPLVGRILGNLASSDEPVEIPNALGGRTAELILANSPASRLLSTTRTLTDPRKNWTTALTNVMSGLRFSDVPERRKEAILRELLSKEMEAAGAKTFERVYFPKDLVQALPPGQRDAALKSTALQTALATRAKKRAEAKRKQQQP